MKATLLADGTVLVTPCTVEATELYDSQTDMFSRTGPMRRLGNINTATLLMDGTVLFVGNSDNDGCPGDAEVYDPKDR